MNAAYDEIEFKRLLFTLPDLVNCSLCGERTCIRTEPLNAMYAYVCARCRKQVKSFRYATMYGAGPRAKRILSTLND